MADKQALNATFFAFRKREKGGVLLTATIAYALICIAAGGLFAALNFPAIRDYATWYAQMIATVASNPEAPPSPEMMMPPASVMALGPMMFLFQILFYVIAAAYEAACLKWMIRGETGGLFGISFGADTWRVYLTYWIWLFLSLAIGVVFLVLFGGVAGSMVAVGAVGGDTNSIGGVALMIPILLLAVCIAWLWLAVRLAPAAATSVARQRFAFFDAWKVTKGRFWALFGAFFLLGIMSAVAFLTLYVAVGVAIAMGVMGQAGAMTEPPTPEQLGAMMLHPAVLIPSALVGLVGTIGYFVLLVATFGVNARAAALALEEGRITAG